MLNLSCENEFYLHENEKVMGISKAETSEKQNEQNIGQKNETKESDQKNRTQKSDKKNSDKSSKEIVGQKMTQRDRPRRRTANWDKKSVGKTSQKSDI